MSDAPANTTAGAILRTFAETIARGYALGRGASVSVAADPASALDLLTAGKPGGAAIVVFYLADTAVGDEGLPEDTLVECQIRVGVVRHRGLASRPVADAPGVIDDVDALRTWLAQQPADGTLTGVWEYAGMTYLQNNAGELLNGYALTYKALYAHEA